MYSRRIFILISPGRSVHEAGQSPIAALVCTGLIVVVVVVVVVVVNWSAEVWSGMSLLLCFLDEPLRLSLETLVVERVRFAIWTPCALPDIWSGRKRYRLDEILHLSRMLWLRRLQGEEKIAGGPKF